MRLWPVALLFISLVSFASAGCGSPYDKVIPSDASRWDTELKSAVEKLKDDERGLLAAYLMRSKLDEAFRGSKSSTNVTIRQAIDEQKRWVEEQAKKEAEEKALKARIAREQAEIRRQIDAVLVVTLVEKSIQKADVMPGRFMDQQMFKLAFENKGSKDIAGIKGTIKFFDIFDKEVGAMSFKSDSGLKAGKTATGTWVRDYNQFIASHRDLANLAEGKYKTRFEPEIVLFSDGSRLASPDSN